MATFSVGAGDHIRPFRNCRVQHFGVDSGQTILIGDPVIRSTDSGDEHLIKLAGDDVSAGILGFAAEAPASGYTKGDKIAVWLADEDAEFLGRGDTVGSDAVDLADIGKARALQIDATNSIWSVDTAKADADAVRIHKFLNPLTREELVADGDVNPAIVFSIVPGAREYGSTSAT